MLNRFRRGSSTGGNNSKNNSPNKAGLGNNNKKSSPAELAARRYNNFNSSPLSSSNSNNNNNDNDEDAAAASALQELREKLDRLEVLTNKIQKDVTAAILTEATIIAEAQNDKSAAANDNDHDRAHDEVNNDKIKNNQQEGSNNYNDETKKAPQQPTTTTKQQQQQPSPPNSQTWTAKFAPISKNDENEMIEILRRIAELVVLSERRAGQILSEVAAAAAAAAMNKQRNSHNHNNSSNSDDDDMIGLEELNTTTSTTATTTLLDEDAALPYLAPFELFCERNVLANIVNIVTGMAFAASSSSPSVGGGSSNDKNQVGQRQRQQHLPPLTIATQAIQSVSILIQNVSRATSLYLLLSNNRVNDLIRLPLDLYKLAEWERLHWSSSSSRGKRQNQNEQQQQQEQLTIGTGRILVGTSYYVALLRTCYMTINRINR